MNWYNIHFFWQTLGSQLPATTVATVAAGTDIPARTHVGADALLCVTSFSKPTRCPTGRSRPTMTHDQQPRRAISRRTLSACRRGHVLLASPHARPCTPPTAPHPRAPAPRSVLSRAGCHGRCRHLGRRCWSRSALRCFMHTQLAPVGLGFPRAVPLRLVSPIAPRKHTPPLLRLGARLQEPKGLEAVDPQCAQRSRASAVAIRSQSACHTSCRSPRDSGATWSNVDTATVSMTPASVE